MTRLPHEWPVDRHDPKVCVHCRMVYGEELVEGEECAIRLRAALDAVPVRGIRWVESTNRRHAFSLVVGSGANEVVIGRMFSGYDRILGHCVNVSAGPWAELYQCDSRKAAAILCRHLGLADVPL